MKGKFLHVIIEQSEMNKPVEIPDGQFVGASVEFPDYDGATPTFDIVLWVADE